MARLQLDLPDPVLRSLERRAAAHGISVEEQVVRELSVATSGADVEEEQLLREIRRERAALAARGVTLTDEFLRQAKSWGRP